MLSQTIPSYLYYEYSDDENLQAFIAAYNSLAQGYVTWFYTLNLPNYTVQTDSLLDWVANGLYGLYRPTLNNALVNDDVFQRCMTWALFKGDGKTFNIRWLKRRIMRFLEGTNGIDYGVNQTYQISVTFGEPNIVYINILGGIATITGGAIFDDNGFKFNAKQFNEIDLEIETYANTTLAPILQEAINAGVLELPFGFEYIVGINP